jgi:hypothetical protein
MCDFMSSGKIRVRSRSGCILSVLVFDLFDVGVALGVLEYYGRAVLGCAAGSSFSSLLLTFSPNLPLIIVLLGFGFMVTFSSILVSS